LVKLDGLVKLVVCVKLDGWVKLVVCVKFVGCVKLVPEAFKGIQDIFFKVALLNVVLLVFWREIWLVMLVRI